MYLGINTCNHDASVCLVDYDHRVVFAAHAERYSRIKNDPHINHALIADALLYGNPTRVLWYEKPWLRNIRQVISGERPRFYSIRRILRDYALDDIPHHTIHHHAAHAAHGYYTSGMSEAVVLVIDAIGEFATSSIYHARGVDIKRIWGESYPHSLGLFYSAITQYCGLKPNEEEYITMGMAAHGKPRYYDLFMDTFFHSQTAGYHTGVPHVKQKHNLHRGVRGLIPPHLEPVDVAASAQAVYETHLLRLVRWAMRSTGCKNIVLVGGCALNCVANAALRSVGYDAIWVPANPGDAGLSLGAIAQHIRAPVHAPHAYLGYDIRTYVDPREVVHALAAGHIVGIANGRAEYGPRALGNRSILADPRTVAMRDAVNALKRRQNFRPFAPVILEEHAHTHFDMGSVDARYMQYATKCLTPQAHPAIIHVDGTSRVQTVSKENPSVIRTILELWHARTKCPMLLNTSLNVRGEPLVNTRADADRFAQQNNITVF